MEPKKVTFLDLANEVLQQSSIPLTPDEIWEKASENTKQKLNSKGKTPQQTLSARLYTNIGQTFFRADGMPARFGLVGKHEGVGIPQQLEQCKTTEKGKNKIGHERNLHPFLASFAKGKMEGVSVKTIFHEKSKKLPFGKWLHPDVVGVKLLWDEKARQLAKLCGESVVTLYSFELKHELNKETLREAFFQCVSNSSWANESWLVANVVDGSNDSQNEMLRLTSRFGIGIIELNVDDPDSGRILIQAQYRDEVDWNTVSKLAGHNPDFDSFLDEVRLAIKESKFVTNNFDEVLDVDKLLQKVKE